MERDAARRSRAAGLLLSKRASFYCVPRPRDDAAEQTRNLEIAAPRMRYSVDRIHVVLRREGWLINHKKTYRIYLEEGLNLLR